MHPKTAPRRVHDAQLKAAVLAACNEPGASIAAVALAHGLNANLVRKWRHGRGLKRSGLAASLSAAPAAAVASPPLLAAGASFVPIETIERIDATTAGAAGDTEAAGYAATIDIELRRGAASLGVRWPVSAAGDCAAWLREVAAGLVK
jgi:transposase